MSAVVYHPNAYLLRIRNIKRGLSARSRILAILERKPADARTVADEAAMHYPVVMHHLKLLQIEGIVERKGAKPHVWHLTGKGQKRLVGQS